MKKFNASVGLDTADNLATHRQAPPFSDALLRSVCTSQQFQLADAPDRVTLLLAACLLACQDAKQAQVQSAVETDQLEPHTCKGPQKSSSLESMYQPWTYIRMIKKLCKVLIYASIVWIVLFGNPVKVLYIPVGIFEAVYQGFNCGWDSNVDNVYTCDK